MLFSGELYVGINLSRGEKSISYAALNHDLEPVTLAQGDYSSLLAYLGAQQQVVVGFYGPAKPNANILVDAERRSQFLIELGKGRPGNMRVAEYTLKQHKYPTFQTPGDAKDTPEWMRTSFKLYQYLQKAGYQDYFVGCQAERQVVEVMPEVAFCAWMEGDLLPRNSFYGRMQRQLILYDLGINLSDPMQFFEEVTRFEILQGILPDRSVMHSGMLTALAAAFIAWQTQQEPEKISLVGVAQEGQIAVPSSVLAGV